jgi:hypothetical protein
MQRNATSSYYTLVAVAAPVLPAMGLLGYVALRDLERLIIERCVALPAPTAFYVQLGSTWVALLGALSALVIALMWPLRRSMLAVFLAGASLVAGVWFMAVALFSVHIVLVDWAGGV